MNCSIIVDPGGSGVTSEINRNRTKDMTKIIAPIIALLTSQGYMQYVLLKNLRKNFSYFLVMCSMSHFEGEFFGFREYSLIFMNKRSLWLSLLYFEISMASLKFGPSIVMV